MTRAGLADLLPAVAHTLGVGGYERGSARAGLLPNLTASHVIVLLIDGLGALQLQDNAAEAPSLAGMADLGSLAAPFPATTCVSLASLGTGLPPGMHGIVGTQFRLEDGSTLAPLSWGAQPNPIATQPEPTVLERASASGVLVTSVGPGAYRDSGLTRAALRGGGYAAAEDRRQRLHRTKEALDRARAAGRRSLTYVYWPDLDKSGHVHGVRSKAYRAALRDADALVAGLLAATGDDVALVVTADHGLIDVPDEHRFDLEADPALHRGVAAVLGEPRARHVYAEEGQADTVRRTWAAALMGTAVVRSRDEVAALMGPVDPWHAERIGDVVAIAMTDWALVSDRVDRVVSGLRGQHGAVTQEEVLVPLRASWVPWGPGGREEPAAR